MSSQGLFIVFEGLDGSGKSTQARLLAEALRKAYPHREIVETREPTQGPWGQKIRKMAQSGQRASVQEELEWFIKDRREHIETLISPSLAAGKIVLQDRYFFSTMAYQGSRGLDANEIFKLHIEFAPMPDCLLLLEIPPQVGLQRIQQRANQPDAFEQLDHLVRCAAIFSQIQTEQVPGLLRLDGLKPQEELHQVIFQHIAKLLAA